jgi:aspartate racemase
LSASLQAGTANAVAANATALRAGCAPSNLSHPDLVRWAQDPTASEDQRMSHEGSDRVLGIVGGTGPESTVDYYRRLVATWQRRQPDGSYPRVIIDSLEAGRIFRNLAAADWQAVGRDLGPAIAALAAAGCQRALLASNASHLAYDAIEPPPSIPLIHIVEATLAAATRAGHRRLGLLGTRFVMESPLYPTRFEAAGIAIVPPTQPDRDAIHEIYFGELVQGVIRDESRQALTDVVAAMRDRDRIDGIILGGTELALILDQETCAGIPVLNTAQIHVESAIDWLRGAEPE